LHGFYHDAKQADSIFQSIVKESLFYIDTHVWQAACEIFFRGNLEAAAASLQNAGFFVTKKADYYALLAWVLAALGKTSPEDVEFLYRKSINLDPTFINPRFYLGQYLFKLGRFEEARHEFNELLQYLSPHGWPSSNPIEQYYEDLISGRNRGEEVKAWTLQYIQKIDAAQAAAKIEPVES
jgi:tetratricopeptide (TPR) repeat protein